MMDIWNPEQYLRFETERNRPIDELIAQIPNVTPRVIYDLGCGPGNSSSRLRQRWSTAQVIGVDNSANMLEKAKQVAPQLTWEQADLTVWQPPVIADLLFSNAALQWLENHRILLPRLLSFLSNGGFLAIQMPRNVDSPMYKALTETIQVSPSRKKLMAVLTRTPDSPSSPVQKPDFYYDLLAPLCKNINIWETEYYHVLIGDNPVAEWKKGTGLLPFLSALEEVDRDAFYAEFCMRVKAYYQPQADGKTLLPYKRLFIVAQKN